MAVQAYAFYWLCASRATVLARQVIQYFPFSLILYAVFIPVQSSNQHLKRGPIPRIFMQMLYDSDGMSITRVWFVSPNLNV